MVIGYDTYHDSAKKGRSVAGVVCSLNRNFTRWYSQCAFQHCMEELVSQLSAIVIGMYSVVGCISSVPPLFVSFLVKSLARIVSLSYCWFQFSYHFVNSCTEEVS